MSEIAFSCKPTVLIVASGLGQKHWNHQVTYSEILIHEELTIDTQVLIHRARDKINEKGEISGYKVLRIIKAAVLSLIRTSDANE